MSDEMIYYDGALYHADDFSDEFLAHYGVPGMKWGRRKARSEKRAINKEYRNKISSLNNKSNSDYKVANNQYKAGKISKEQRNKKYDDIERKYEKNYDNLLTERGNKKRAVNYRRKQAIKANKANYKANYKAARKKNPVKTNPFLIDSRYTSARANGANKKQALANVYTRSYDRKSIYNR